MKDYLLKDNENLITWDIIPSFAQMGTDQKDYEKKLKKYTSQLNHWNDEDIKSFITKEKLGNHIVELLNEEFINNTACFAINKLGKVLGVVILSPPFDKDVNLDYIITHPKSRGKGLGTRMIKSIKENITTMLKSPKYIELIHTLIRNNNELSKKAFLKNNFYLKPANTDGHYGVYYCRLRNKENENNEIIMD